MKSRLEKWRLHDIDDVHSLVFSRLSRLSSFKDLSEDDKEDAFQAMLEQVVVLEKQWKGDSQFSTFVWSVLPNKLIDYFRRYHKDTRFEHERNTEIILTDDYTLMDSAHWDETEDVPDEHELLDGIDLDSLSDTGRETLFRYAIPLRRGQDIEALSELNNVTERWIRKRLTDLAVETNAF